MSSGFVVGHTYVDVSFNVCYRACDSKLAEQCGFSIRDMRWIKQSRESALKTNGNLPCLTNRCTGNSEDQGSLIIQACQATVPTG